MRIKSFVSDSWLDLDLSPARIDDAARYIPHEFLNSPQYEDPLLNKDLGRCVTVKVETLNPLRSFKGRGISFALRDLAEGEHIMCASSGNFGQAVAFTARLRHARATVFVPCGANPVKVERIRSLGAGVIEVSGGIDAARQQASDAAAHAGARLIIDGVDPAIAEGAATIALELGQLDPFDTVVVPVGDGSLISGVALWMRTHSPQTKVVGVNPAAAPAMYESWRRTEQVEVLLTSRFAEGITIPKPHEAALKGIIELVDDFVLVTDDEIRAAMKLIERRLALNVEPAGAAGIAAIASCRIQGERLATIITGANGRGNISAKAGVR